MSTTRPPRLPDLDACPCSGRNLDRLIQPAVLAVLAAGPLHGYRIVQDLASMPTFEGRCPDAAGVYRFLKAMENRGLVSSAWDLSEAGPAKRLFELSEPGRQCLSLWATTLKGYQQQIGRLARTLRSAIARRPARRRRCQPKKPSMKG